MFAADKHLWTFHDTSKKDFIQKETRLAKYLTFTWIWLFIIIWIIFWENILHWTLYHVLRGNDLLGILIIGWFLCIIQWCVMFYLIRKYQKLEIYISTKETLEDFLERLQDSISTDKKEQWINVITLDEIQNIIQQISTMMSFIQGPLISFYNTQQYLQNEVRVFLKEYLSCEIVWFLDYTRKFQSLLWSWLNHHTKELEQENKKLRDSGESMIHLASENLSTHIKSLEKVRVQI